MTPVPYSKVYHDATFEPVSVTIGPILMKFWLFVAGCCLLLGVEKVTSTSLRNQRGFEAKITPVSYSKVYHNATFEPVSVTIGSILVKFWILPLKLMHTLCLIEEIVCEFWLLPLKLMHTLCLIEEIAKCLMCSYHSTVNSS